MMTTFKQKILKLIDVKSIVTFALTGVFGYLAISGLIKDNPEFTAIYTTIMGFYFGTQSTKEKNN